MKKRINDVFGILGVLFILYWLACGLFVRFGQSMLWIWPALGACSLLRYALVRSSLKRGVPLPIPSWAVTAIRLLFCAGLVVFLAAEGLILSGIRSDCPENIDYLIILGAKTGSVTIERRIDTAAEYLLRNPDTIAIATGGKGTDEEIAEGAYIRNGLIERGIGGERIRTEESSVNTSGNLKYARELIADTNASAAVVSNEYHLFRARLLAKKVFGRKVSALGFRSLRLTFPHYMVREFVGLIHDLVLGNL